MKKSFSNKMYKSLFTSALVFTTLTSPVIVLAQNYDELIGGTQMTIEGLTAQQASLYAELAAAYAEIEAINTEANDLVKDVAEDDKTIAELEQQIQKLEKLINNRQGLLAEQARAVQVTGGSTNYLNYVASSKDVSDFVGRVDVVRKMVSANKDLLNTQIADKEAVEAKKAEVVAAKEVKVVKMVDLESLKASLEATLTNQEAVFQQLTSDLTLAEANREALIAEKESFEAAQVAAAEEAMLLAAQTQEEAMALVAAPTEETQVVEEATYTNEMAFVEQPVEAPVTEVTTQEPVSTELTEVEAVTELPVVEEATSEEVTFEEVTVSETTTIAAPIEGPAGSITVLEDQAAAQAEAERIAAEEAAAQAEAERIAAEEAAAQAEAERIAAEEAAALEAAAQAEAERIAAEEAAALEAAAAEEAAAQPAAPSGDLLGNAAKYLGTPYVWGGKSPSGFDCSGFVQYVFKETYGVDIGGWTGAQEYAGTRISVAEAQPGDLYFWGSPGGTYHVAIATGGGSYIHASQPGTPLEYNSIQWFTPDFAVRVN